jgi:effector-binding domain-containing protein
MFQLKQAHIQQVIEAEQARLARIAARLRQIEQEGTMPAYEILVKQIDPLLVAATRANVSIEDDLSQLYGRIFAYLDQRGVQQVQSDLLLRYSRYTWQHEGMYADVELAVPLRAPLPGNDLVSVRTLPGGLMASTVHTGDALSLGRAYLALHRWMEENGYRFSGAPREVYLQRGEYRGPASAVTELLFPIEKQYE